MEIVLVAILLAIGFSGLYVCYKVEEKMLNRHYERLEKALTNALINSRIAK